MAAEDWTTTPPMAPRGDIADIALAVPEKPPPPPEVDKPPPKYRYVPPDQCQGGHHKPAGPSFDWDEYEQMVTGLDRLEAWGHFQTAVSTVERNWNTAAPLVNDYNNAQDDPTLQSDETGLQSLGGGFLGDVAGMASEQRVPPASGSKTTVGNLFEQTETGRFDTDGGEVVMYEEGTALADSPDGASLDKLAQDPKVRDKRAEVVAADQRISTQLSAIRASALGIESAAATLRSKQARAELDEAEQEQSAAAGSLAKLESAKKQADSDAKKVLGLLKKVATAGNPLAAAGEVVDFAVGEAIDAVAREVADARYRTEIAQATSRLAAASAKVRSLTKKEIQAEISAAALELQKSQTEFDTECLALKPLLTDRRNLYEQLGRVIGSSSSVSKGVRRQVQAIVTAIPIVEVVVSRTGGVVTALGDVSYTDGSGVGLAMARYAKMPIGDQFVSIVGNYYGLQSDFAQKQQFWEARLAGLRSVMTRLSGLHSPPM